MLISIFFFYFVTLKFELQFSIQTQFIFSNSGNFSCSVDHIMKSGCLYVTVGPVQHPQQSFF